MNILYYVAALAIMFSMNVKADTTLNRFLEGKVVIHHGGCTVNGNGEVVTKEKATGNMPCVAGVDPRVPHIHYILLFVADRPVRLVTFDWNEEVQKSILWRVPSI